jgi:uncharacterized protein DUF6527
VNIPLRLIECPEGNLYPVLDEDDELKPGDVWRAHECWAVVLPNRTVWYSGIPSSSGAKWTTTGEAPNLTVTPSINDQSSRPWHGWITNGELVQA